MKSKDTCTSTKGLASGKLLAPLVLVLFGLGCGDDEHTGQSMQAVDCQMETRADNFSTSLEKSTPSGIRVQMTMASPAQPAKGLNDWTLSITDAAGAPQTGLTLEVFPFMPDHGHGTTPAPTISEGTGGTYTISGLNLFMPGYWTVTITVGNEDVVFATCIQG